MELKKIILYKLKTLNNIQEINIIGNLQVSFECADNKEKIITKKTIYDKETEYCYVIYYKDSFKPIESFNKYILENQTVEYKSFFSKRSIKMKAKDSSGYKKRTLSNNENIFDNTQIYSLIKNLNFSNENILNIKILSNVLGRYEDCEVKFYGREVTLINGRSYNAIRISITLLFCNITQFLLFSDDAEKILLKAITGNQILEFDSIKNIV